MINFRSATLFFMDNAYNFKKALRATFFMENANVKGLFYVKKI